MDSVIDKLISQITEWKTIKGFFIITLIILLFPFYSGLKLEIHLIVGIILALSAWSVLWSIKSARVLLPSPRKTIVFSFRVDSEGIRNYSRILDSLNNKLQTLGLFKQIRLINGAPDLIKNTQHVTEYRRKNNVELVVWGKSLYGNLESKKILKFEVNHTCEITPNLNAQLQLFLADLAFILQRRKWVIEELNELSDVQVVAEDFLETCLFIIGIYLFTEGDSKNSIILLESILPSFEQKAATSKDEVRILQASRVRNILLEAYFFEARTAHDRNENDIAIEILNKILPMVPNKTPVLILLSRSYYFNEDISNAKKYTNILKSIDKKHPAVYINNAFFEILHKNYEKVRYWYDEVLKLPAIKDVNIFSVITFLDNEYKNKQLEHAFLYALGIMNGYVDPKIRKTELQKFISITKGLSEYTVLRRRAQEILKF